MTTYRVSPYISQHPWDRAEGAPYGTRGGIVTKHTFVADGLYELRFNVAGGIGTRLEDIDVSIDGARVALLHYERGVKALKDGGVYRDDIGQCWPAGMPLIMTRVWPIAVVQLPTVVYMISHFENSVRIIYLDGRPHTDPDVVVRTFNGESIGRWEGDTLIVDTKYFPGHHHWMDQGGASVPVSEDMHIVERYKMMPDGRLDIEYLMTDPQNWVGEWKMTKTFRVQEQKDISEVSCLPDLNDRLPATSSKRLVK